MKMPRLGRLSRQIRKLRLNLWKKHADKGERLCVGCGEYHDVKHMNHSGRSWMCVECQQDIFKIIGEER
jgi:hypothetical protein